MPGGNAKPKRQDNGASKSRTKSRSKALNAFALAEEVVPEGKQRGLRTRALEPSPEPQARKRGHDDDEDDEDDEDEDDEDDDRRSRMRKRAKKGEDGEEFDDPDMEMEEDSEGNEWHVGVGGDDEDSDIDSDEAFGEGDDEAFEGYAFRGSSSKDKKKSKKKSRAQQDSDDEEEEEDDDDLSSLGSDAIDLATALDQFSESDEDEAAGSASSGSGSEEDDDESSSETSDSDDDEEDAAGKDALKALISGFAGDEDEDADAKPSGKAKIGLKDLGLFGVKDPHIKKSLKLMNKEEKATKPGTSKKLDIPLAKRQQDKLLRTAAFEKASETLDRWTDTVKSNRRADHLFFPLAQNAHDAGLNKEELLPLTAKTADTELEQTIMAIMEESGLSKSTKTKMDKKLDAMEEAKDPSISRAELKEIWNQRRRERELASRELVRSKRIKKIKSKAYRRVHRRERLGEEEANLTAMKEAGEIDSEEEKEAQDRRRAMERMGSKHKDSKWAKMGSKAGRAVWDDDFRSGLTDMARRDEELRKRIEGRTADGSDDDEDDDGSVDSDDDNRDRLLQELDRAAVDDPEPQTGLMAMKFMLRGEEALKKANDEMVAQIRKDLGSDEDEDDEDEEQPDVGRRQYGANKVAAVSKPTRPTRQEKADGFVIDTKPSGLATGLNDNQTSALGAAGAWSRAGQPSRKGKKGVKGPNVEELDLSNAAILATSSKSSSKSKSNGTKTKTQGDDSSSEDEDTIHLPMAIRDTELIKRAFAGEDVVAEFEKEKNEVAEEDDDKEIDNTLPGWGNWVGDGVSARDRKKHAGRFITKVDGIKKKDRKDFKLEKVIVNEKRVRKVSSIPSLVSIRSAC